MYFARLLTSVIVLWALTAAAFDEFEGAHWSVGDPMRHIVSSTHLPDSADIAAGNRKSFWRAGAEVVGCNLSLWAFDRYVQKGHYAYISWKTIRDNFRHGFEWDNDHLNTNMFAHPYHGSIYFNAGRANGFNFWQSELFAIGGSAMWEMFMECEYPSTNDIIATPVGGAAIGEVLFRTSDLILDDRATGAERAGRELAAFLVSPMRGFNRLITGCMWRHNATSGRRFGVPPISVEMSVGARVLTSLDEGSSPIQGGVAEVLIDYGEPFAETTRHPYDYFTFLLEMQVAKNQPLISRIEIAGRLLSREIVDRKDLNVNIGMYQHFDFYDSDTIASFKGEFSPLRPSSVGVFVPYKMGTPASVGVGTLARYTGLNGMTFNARLHLNGMALAGILTDFYRKYHRNYNWGSGYSVQAGLEWSLNNHRLSVTVADQFYKVFTWTGEGKDVLGPNPPPSNLQGDRSRSSFNHLELQASYRIGKHLYLTGGIDYYSRRSNYRSDHKWWSSSTQDILAGWPSVWSDEFGAQLLLTWKF